MGDEWPLTKLGDFLDIKTGNPFKSKDYSEDTGIKLLRGDNIVQGQFRWANVKYWPENLLGDKEQDYFLNTGDVILAMDRPWIEAGLKTAQINESDLPCLLVQRTACLKAKNSEDQDYLRYLISSYWFVQYVKLVQTGTAVPHISAKQIKNFEFKKPPQKDRVLIGQMMKSLDSKIHLNNQTNQTLEKMAQTLFKSWFVDFDPVFDNLLATADFKLENLPRDFPETLLNRAEKRLLALDDNAKTSLLAATLSSKAISSENKSSENRTSTNIHQHFPNEFEHNEQLGWIPKGWNDSNVGNEFDVTMGQSPPGSTYNEIEEGVPFFQGKTDYGFRFPSNRIYCTAPKRLAEKNDTLVSVRAPVGTINLAAEKCAIGRGLAAVRHKSGSISFTYYAMNNLAKNFEVFEGEGTVFGSINQKDFNALPQLSISSKLVSVFNHLCTSWDEKIQLTSLQIIELTKLRDTLLPKLISGELQIPDALETTENSTASIDTRVRQQQ